MTRRYLRPLAGLMLGMAALAAPLPASAGSMTMVFTPRGDAADLLQAGLQIYSLVEHEKGKKGRTTPRSTRRAATTPPPCIRPGPAITA